jgi:hypothetical protein
VLLLANLFQFLPPDGNEVLADRDELARVTDCSPTHVSEIMGDLEAIGAVYRARKAETSATSSTPGLARTWPVRFATRRRPRLLPFSFQPSSPEPSLPLR